MIVKRRVFVFKTFGELREAVKGYSEYQEVIGAEHTSFQMSGAGDRNTAQIRTSWSYEKDRDFEIYLDGHFPGGYVIEVGDL